MQILSYGYKKPETKDKGSVFFPALEDNIQRVNDHTHNGTNSSKLAASSIEAISQTIASGSWADQGDSTFRQLITMPSGLEFDNTHIGFTLNTAPYAGKRALLSVEKVTANTYYVYIGINSLEVLAVYTS